MGVDDDITGSLARSSGRIKGLGTRDSLTPSDGSPIDLVIDLTPGKETSQEIVEFEIVTWVRRLRLEYTMHFLS